MQEEVMEIVEFVEPKPLQNLSALGGGAADTKSELSFQFCVCACDARLSGTRGWYDTYNTIQIITENKLRYSMCC
jgi:hypothetical protein